MQEVHVSKSGNLQALGKSAIVDRGKDELEDARKQVVVDVGASEKRIVGSHRAGQMLDLALYPLFETLDQRVAMELIEEATNDSLHSGELFMPGSSLLLGSERFDDEPRLPAGQLIDRSAVSPEKEQDELVNGRVVCPFYRPRSHTSHRRLKLTTKCRRHLAIEFPCRPQRMLLRIFVLERNLNEAFRPRRQHGGGRPLDLRKHVAMGKVHRLGERRLPGAVGTDDNAEAARKLDEHLLVASSAVTTDGYPPKKQDNLQTRQPTSSGDRPTNSRARRSHNGRGRPDLAIAASYLMCRGRI